MDILLRHCIGALRRIAAGPNDQPFAEPWSQAEARIALDRVQGVALDHHQLRGVVDLHASGDLLQSSASRMAEWIKAQPEVPYEVHMAACEAANAVNDWTAVRSRGAVSDSRAADEAGE